MSHSPTTPIPFREALADLSLAARVEAATLIALMLVAVPAARLLGWEAAPSALGPAHGVAFLWWFARLLDAATFGLIRWHWVGLGLLGAIVPTGTIWVELGIRRSLTAQDRP